MTMTVDTLIPTSPTLYLRPHLWADVLSKFLEMTSRDENIIISTFDLISRETIRQIFQKMNISAKVIAPGNDVRCPLCGDFAWGTYCTRVNCHCCVHSFDCWTTNVMKKNGQITCDCGRDEYYERFELEVGTVGTGLHIG